MAGLMPMQGAGGAAAPGGAAAQPSGRPPQGGQPPMRGEAPTPDGTNMPQPQDASPEEQNIYEHVVSNAVTAIYSGETADMIVQLMEPSEHSNPVEQLAAIIAPMMIGIEASGAENDVPVSRDMTVQAVLEIVEDIGTNLLPEAGLEPLTEGEIEAAFLKTCQLIGADQKAAQDLAASQNQDGGEAMPGGGSPPQQGGGLMPRPAQGVV